VVVVIAISGSPNILHHLSKQMFQ